MHSTPHSDALRDSELFSGISNGDESAFNELITKYAERLYRFAYVRTYDNDIAEDAVQDVFAYLWENREYLSVKDGVRSYLYRAVANRTISILRHSKSQQRVEQIVVNDYGSPYHDVSLNEGEILIEAEEIEKIIHEIISALPPRTREIFLLSKEQGLSYSEISSVLDVGIPTIRNQVSKATQAILAGLEDWQKNI